MTTIHLQLEAWDWEFLPNTVFRIPYFNFSLKNVHAPEIPSTALPLLHKLLKHLKLDKVGAKVGAT
jgi:hypothetical protein